MVGCMSKSMNQLLRASKKQASIAVAQAQSGLNIGDNDSIYVDEKSFQCCTGKARGDAAAQIRTLGSIADNDLIAQNSSSSHRGARRNSRTQLWAGQPHPIFADNSLQSCFPAYHICIARGGA